MEDLKTVDGKEYVIADTDCWVQLFTLDNGRKITVKELALCIDSSNACARARLNASSDPEVLFRVVRKMVKPSKGGQDRKTWIKSKNWYTDPMVKLMLK